MARQINVTNQAVAVLVSVKTKELTEALDKQATALEELVKSMRDFNDWLEEELVRMEGEK